LFFGRKQEASDLLSLTVAHGEVLVYAQSGAGKTSLLNARLIPLLEEEGFEVFPLARVRGIIPKELKLEEIANLYIFNTLLGWAERALDPRELAQLTLARFLKRADNEREALPRIIIFDQFEELFSFYPERWRDREAFFEQVRETLEADPLLRVVFVLREDYLAQLDPYAPLLPEELRTRFRLERMPAIPGFR
jgi:conflict system STAND superfamily ATPase